MGIYPNAQLVLNSRDRNLLQTVTAAPSAVIVQNYSKFNLQKPGQNIIQGDIDKIQVAEVYFPYDVPNVLTGSTDTLWIVADLASTSTTVKVEIPAGFYTGKELESTLNSAISAALNTAIPGIPAADIPSFQWQETTGRYLFIQAASTAVYDMYAYPIDPAAPQTTAVKNCPKNLLSLMGFFPFTQGEAGTFPLSEVHAYVEAGPPAVLVGTYGNPAQMVYTTFIDICSTSLCGNTYVRDGSSIPQGAAFRQDLLCRVYITNETSNVEYILNFAGDQERNIPGIRPFIIHRQFKNAKLIKNNLKNSIGNVDITLFDDCGNVLPFGQAPSQAFYPRDFQVTLNVYESASNET